MSNYTKSIKAIDDCVEATIVRNINGSYVCRDIFMHWPWYPASWSLESRLKRAHKWADETISALEKYEVLEDPELSALRQKNLTHEWRGEYEE